MNVRIDSPSYINESFFGMTFNVKRMLSGSAVVVANPNYPGSRKEELIFRRNEYTKV